MRWLAGLSSRIIAPRRWNSTHLHRLRRANKIKQLCSIAIGAESGLSAVCPRYLFGGRSHSTGKSRLGFGGCDLIGIALRRSSPQTALVAPRELPLWGRKSTIGGKAAVCRRLTGSALRTVENERCLFPWKFCEIRPLAF